MRAGALPVTVSCPGAYCWFVLMRYTPEPEPRIPPDAWKLWVFTVLFVLALPLTFAFLAK